MSKELTPIDEMAVPNYAQADGTAAAGLVVSVKKNRLKLRDAKFILAEDGVDEKSFGLGKPVAVVILGVSPPEPKLTSKVYYNGSWVEGDTESPDCYSNDGLRPDASIAEPQCETCALCPQAAWGSAMRDDGTPGKGKACSDRKNLIVSLFGKDGVSNKIFELSVPPTSLKALSKYGMDLLRVGANMHAAVTRVGIDDAESKQMTFSLFRYLEQAPAMECIERAASDEVKQMVSPAFGVAAPAAQPALEAPPEHAKVEEDIDDEPEPEPAISERSARAKKAAATRAANKAKKEQEATEPDLVAEVANMSDDEIDMSEMESLLDDLPGL